MADPILLIEDEELLGTELSKCLSRQGWEVTLSRSLAKARRHLKFVDPLVVVSDLSLPDGNALELLEHARHEDSESEWIFITGYGGVPESVRAMRLGAYDFLQKPVSQAHLELIVSGAARSARAQRRLSDLTARSTRRYTLASFVGHSRAATRVRAFLSRLTRVPFSTLILGGETGTGKGLTARIVHHAGPRASGPMIEVNCAALPNDLLESELFGHEAGAFTGAKSRKRGLMEQASGGTLFLDEVSELDLDLQAKLLNAIEDRSIRRIGGGQQIQLDIQLIAATNRNLESMVVEDRFRSDLFHRLNVFRLDLPPLRERKEDLRELVPMLTSEFNAKAGKNVEIIPDEVWDRLQAHNWPGNVRELANVVERCVLFADSRVFPPEWLQLGAGLPHLADQDGGDGGLYVPLDGTVGLEEMDCRIIEAVLSRNGYNILAAARALHTTRETLRYRIQKYGLKIPG